MPTFRIGPRSDSGHFLNYGQRSLYRCDDVYSDVYLWRRVS